jgi:hypothetical protein
MSSSSSSSSSSSLPVSAQSSAGAGGAGRSSDAARIDRDGFYKLMTRFMRDIFTNPELLPGMNPWHYFVRILGFYSKGQLRPGLFVYDASPVEMGCTRYLTGLLSELMPCAIKIDESSFGSLVSFSGAISKIPQEKNLLVCCLTDPSKICVEIFPMLNRMNFNIIFLVNKTPYITYQTNITQIMREKQFEHVRINSVLTQEELSAMARAIWPEDHRVRTMSRQLFKEFVESHTTKEMIEQYSDYTIRALPTGTTFFLKNGRFLVKIDHMKGLILYQTPDGKKTSVRLVGKAPVAAPAPAVPVAPPSPAPVVAPLAAPTHPHVPSGLELIAAAAAELSKKKRSADEMEEGVNTSALSPKKRGRPSKNAGRNQ